MQATPTRGTGGRRGNGRRSETASCISVFVTVPPSSTPAPPVDACKVGGFHVLSWSWLKCNSGAVSALASFASAIIAFVIGFLVFLLNRNIRKGQIAHEQMRMLLEIDGELVDRPELWAVHGTTYLPAPFPSKDIDARVEAFRTASRADKPAAAQVVADALCANPNATKIVELRQLAFTTRYLNSRFCLPTTKKGPFGDDTPRRMRNGRHGEHTSWIFLGTTSMRRMNGRSSPRNTFIQSHSRSSWQR